MKRDKIYQIIFFYEKENEFLDSLLRVIMKMSLKCHCPVQLLLTSLHQALSWDCLSASDIAFFFLHNSMVLLITEYWSQSFPNFIETEKVHSTFLWISMEFHRHLSYSWACVFILQLNMMVSFLLLSNQHDITWNPYLFFFLSLVESYCKNTKNS